MAPLGYLSSWGSSMTFADNLDYHECKEVLAHIFILLISLLRECFMCMRFDRTYILHHRWFSGCNYYMALLCIIFPQRNEEFLNYFNRYSTDLRKYCPCQWHASYMFSHLVFFILYVGDHQFCVPAGVCFKVQWQVNIDTQLFLKR